MLFFTFYDVPIAIQVLLAVRYHGLNLDTEKNVQKLFDSAFWFFFHNFEKFSLWVNGHSTMLIFNVSFCFKYWFRFYKTINKETSALMQPWAGYAAYPHVFGSYINVFNSRYPTENWIYSQCVRSKSVYFEMKNPYS